MTSLTLKMDDATVQDLVSHGASLFGFVASQGADDEARPVIWFKTNKFSANTLIEWQDAYSAYTSLNPVDIHQSVAIADSKEIKTGQTLEVSENGLATVNPQGAAGYITVHNKTKSEFTCGVTGHGNYSTGPTCIYALHGKNTVTIKPLPKILLIFSTSSDTAGMIIEEIYSGASTRPGALINLSAMPDKSTVVFRMNEGWKKEDWLESVPSDANLVPYLIQTQDQQSIDFLPGQVPSRTEVTCKNDGAFLMKFKVSWSAPDGHNGESGWTDVYPIGSSRTIVLNSLNIPNGSMVKPIVKAILGKTDSNTKSIQYFSFSQRISTLVAETYKVSGTTLNIKVENQPTD